MGVLGLGLVVNQRLVQADQKQYHDDLAARFEDMRRQLRPHCTLPDDSPARAEHELQRMRSTVVDSDLAFLEDA